MTWEDRVRIPNTCTAKRAMDKRNGNNNLFVSNNDLTRGSFQKAMSVQKLIDWKPLGRLPSLKGRGPNGVGPSRKVQKINRYLAVQEARIISAIWEKKYNKAVLIWFMLLKNSKSYQICLFNNVVEGWYYKYSQSEARKLLQIVMNKCRSWDLQMLLHRYYILKKSGK